MPESFEQLVKPCFELSPEDLRGNSLWVFFYDEDGYDESDVRKVFPPRPIPEHYLYICGGTAKTPLGFEFAAQFEIEIDRDFSKVRLDCLWHNDEWLELNEMVGGVFPAPPPGIDREHWLREQSIKKRIALLQEALDMEICKVLPLEWKIDPQLAKSFGIPASGQLQLMP